MVVLILIPHRTDRKLFRSRSFWSFQCPFPIAPIGIGMDLFFQELLAHLSPKHSPLLIVKVGCLVVPILIPYMLRSYRCSESSKKYSLFPIYFLRIRFGRSRMPSPRIRSARTCLGLGSPSSSASPATRRWTPPAAGPRSAATWAPAWRPPRRPPRRGRPLTWTSSARPFFRVYPFPPLVVFWVSCFEAVKAKTAICSTCDRREKQSSTCLGFPNEGNHRVWLIRGHSISHSLARVRPPFSWF